MASIERTAYPRFKRSPSARELETLYTPTADELSFARANARKAQPRFGLLLLLKSFQRLGYFPAVDDIPPSIVQHIRAAASIDAESSPSYEEQRTLYRHHQMIRERLGVWAFRPGAKMAYGWRAKRWRPRPRSWTIPRTSSTSPSKNWCISASNCRLSAPSTGCHGASVPWWSMGGSLRL